MTSYVGVDWASRGWLAVAIDDREWTVQMYPSIHSVWFEHKDAESILVDIPIGLPEEERRGCDRGAKEFLGPKRSRSVFWTPSRDAVEQETYDDAKQANIDARNDSISSQAWGLIPRIREVDHFLRDNVEAQSTVFESHPEVCFKSLSENSLISKHEDDGLDIRQEVLEDTETSAKGVYDRFVQEHIKGQAAWKRRIGNSNRDDLLDAMVLALTGKMGDGEFERILGHTEADVNSVPQDREGLPMQIVYYDPHDP